MAADTQSIKMVAVESDLFESIGYKTGLRQLYIKFRNAPAVCYNDVPGFRFEGLLAAPRKDAYFKTFIKDVYISKAAQLPVQTQF
ncbi:MAG: KTSC domain-containing protein [Verrucomicrobiota bacterium]|jgi:hypothetical protein